MKMMLATLIIVAPFVSSLIVGILYLLQIKGMRVSKRLYDIFALTTPLVAFIAALQLFFSYDAPLVVTLFEWIKVDQLVVSFDLLIDKLSLFMALFISFIGWLIHIYATGYMDDDRGYGKFFFYFNLFITSMLLLVLANNPVIMFIGWEGVGFCSYLLISYYYDGKENVGAGNKAFLTNRVGDLGFIIGYVTLFIAIGQGGFDFISLEQNAQLLSYETAFAIGLFLFIGAMAKSAQIPLYVWLPDAMAGPTPVSALIHAATMVTAGVYMVARFYFIYEQVADIGLFIAYIGALSSLFAAIIATKQSDIKKILAYSTMSQLGYMFVAVGLGVYSAGLFHVFTHAFFKALLFLGAGAIIVTLHHEQNIFKMGALRRDTPFLYVVMLIATLAISGIPPFAGFFSKDEILLQAFVSENYLLWVIGLITAILTAYYMFRMFFIVFDATNPNRLQDTHPVSWKMKAPLVVLAVGSVFAGVLGVPVALGGDYLVGGWIDFDRASGHIAHSTEYILMVVNILAAALGIFVAYKKFYNVSLDASMEPTNGVVVQKFYIDELYEALFVANYKRLSFFISEKVDLKIIDALVMGISKGILLIGNQASSLQNGNIRSYALYMLFGVSMTFVYLLVVLG
jgi:NADH-quinone oxidoreductase subunit L